MDRVKTRELPDVNTLHTALTDAVSQSSSAAIVHGDFRIDNTILDEAAPTIVRAVVDWELSTLGDPLTDVALRLPLADIRPRTRYRCGMDQPSHTVGRHLAQTYAVASGRDLDAWNFYVALANFKLGIIGEGITHRALRGSYSGNGAARAAEATPEFMAAGLRAIRKRHV